MTTQNDQFEPARFASYDLPNDSLAYVMQRIVEIEGLLQGSASVQANARLALAEAEDAYRAAKARFQLRVFEEHPEFKNQAQRDAWVFERTSVERSARDRAEVVLEYAVASGFDVKKELEALEARLPVLRREYEGPRR